jgi:hypothetical protein
MPAFTDTPAGKKTTRRIKASQKKIDLDLEKKAWDRHSHPKVSMESRYV